MIAAGEFICEGPSSFLDFRTSVASKRDKKTVNEKGLQICRAATEADDIYVKKIWDMGIIDNIVK